MKEEVFKILKEKALSLSFVESCTAGGLARSFAAQVGASEVLKGSLVTYQDEVKVNLGVQAEVLQKNTAVCKEVALQMAASGAKFFKSDYVLATTGWAGPGGGTSDDPVGTVYFAVWGKDLEVVERRTFKESNGRESIMNSATEYAWAVLLKNL